MSDEGWVTDPKVIDTLVGLRAIEPGDEIRIVRAKAYNISPRFEGQVVTVTAPAGFPVGAPSQDNCEFAGEPVAVHFEDNWVGCRKNIAAWRRPITCADK